MSDEPEHIGRVSYGGAGKTRNAAGQLADTVRRDMFSAEYCIEIEKRFRERMELLEHRILRLGGSHKALLSRAHGSEEDLTQLRRLSGKLLTEKRDEILETLAHCTGEEAQALTFLYGAMPMSDLLDYPAALFLAYARHGVFLWNQGPFAGRVPEELFANYVLHHRVNNEDIADTRGFFYDRLKGWLYACADADADNAGGAGEDTEERAAENAGDVKSAGTAGVNMQDAAICVNYWCAGEASYRATDDRTQNPGTVYRTAIGRCGEESTFTVTALRSMGIPARQVYAPLWSHCDDNHAWVEVWCDGEWYFLGACEPEERLNLGWFNLPASRAMLVHSKWFGAGKPTEISVGTAGMAKILNHLERYARTVPLTVRVSDENGQPVPGAKVDFRVLNQGSFGSIAALYTGAGEADCGEVRFVTGLGDLFVTASAGFDISGGRDFGYGEKHISLAGAEPGKEARCEITLGDGPECRGEWQDLDFHAPKLCSADAECLTPGAGDDRKQHVLTEQNRCGEGSPGPAEEQNRRRERRLARAAETRREKEERFYKEEEARRVLSRFEGREQAQLEEILRSARGNMSALVRFLEWDAAEWLPGDWAPGHGEGWKREVLRTLREKDYWDLDPEVLKDCCIHALPYAGSVPDDIFFNFLLCPRVADEVLRPCRGILKDVLGEHTIQSVRETPEKLLKIVDGWVCSLPGQEYGNLVISPRGCLRGGIAGELSRDVFCVNAYRALGIPARRSSFDGEIEYYRGGCFIPVNRYSPSSRYRLSIDQCLAGRHCLPSEHYSMGEHCLPNEHFSISKHCLQSNGQNEHACAQIGQMQGYCLLTLCESSSLKLNHWERYSLERFEGDGFRRLRTDGRLGEAENGALTLRLKPGCYRVITVNRKQNGDQLARMSTFVLEEGESRKVTLSAREIPLEEMSRRVKVSDFELGMPDRNLPGNSDSAPDPGEGDGNRALPTVLPGGGNGKRALLSALTGGGKALFLWLEVGKEPTEHILNELRDRSRDYRALSVPIYAVLKNAEDLENPTLRRTMEALPALCPLLGDFGEIYEKLAQELGREKGKLPLVMIMDGGQECIYSDAGYNVGQADILWKFLK